MTTSFLHVDFQQPAEMRFNRARVRRAFVTIGQRHMRDARRLVMRRARSAPGENPGYQTGRLARSIGYMVPRASKHRPGFMARIAPNQRNGEGTSVFDGMVLKLIVIGVHLFIHAPDITRYFTAQPVVVLVNISPFGGQKVAAGRVRN